MTGNNHVMGIQYLLRKQTVFFVTAILLFSSTAQAQYKELNRPEHDDLPYYFGIYLAYNTTYLHPSKSYKFLQDDSILTAEPGSSGGVALGFLGTLKLNKRLELRLNPNLVIGGSRYFTYTL